MPSTRCCSGRNSSSERVKSGLREAAVAPRRAGRRRPRRGRRPGAGSAALSAGDRDAPSSRRGRATSCGARAVGLLEQAQRVGRGLERRPSAGRPCAGERDGGRGLRRTPARRPSRRGSPTAARWSSSSRQSSPKRSESASDDDAAGAVLGDRERAARRARRRRGEVRATTRAPPGVERRRAVEARAARRRRAGRRRGGAAVEVGEDPVRRVVVALVVADDRVLERDAEARRASASRLLPYLSCSSSPRTSRPPPARDERLDRVELVGGRARGSRRARCAPTWGRTGGR